MTLELYWRTYRTRRRLDGIYMLLGVSAKDVRVLLILGNKLQSTKPLGAYH